MIFSEVLNPVSAESLAVYDLRSPGSDSTFDTFDDVIYDLSPSYDGNVTVTLTIDSTMAPLPSEDYRFTIYSELDGGGNVIRAIVDTAGLALDGDDNSTEGGNYVRSFIVDNVAPVVTAVTPAGTSTITAAAANIDVTFSELVVGVDATDLVLSGAASAGALVGAPAHIGGDTWRFPVSGLGHGTLDVSLAPDADGIEDLAGNDLDPQPTTWSYTVSHPQVESVHFKDGLSQRSRVVEAKVTFTEEVVVDAGAITVFKRGTGGGFVDTTVALDSSSGKTVATLTFSGTFTEYSSLVDGNYELRIDAAKVRSVLANITLDGDDDGAPGGNYVLGDEEADNFFRHFGDSDGDRDVDNLDFLRFRQTFRISYPDPAYKWYLDFDGDGDVDNLDFLRFRMRFRGDLPFA